MDFVSVDEVFEDARGKYEKAIVLGYDNDGYLKVNTTGAMRTDEILWMIEQYKVRLLNGEYNRDEK